MNKADIEKAMWQVIEEALNMGPGYAQESYVLRTTWENLGRPADPRSEQLLLDVWYGLIREGKLVWGHNLSNPSAPFFHKPVE